ncbi:NADP oxidoreductase [Archangium sp. Cb G35]|uniref:NADPH-dependent F420 reductase n=1 Tax=Archangium sp. Cb G35 TaxID=1920190 RepID=UPI0009374313|nr:NAD(P)-binding domain-containing protein [Archangium sp. Cb G35]OJT20004.1 NADP oxidoreductase [Archangium sp. Cb G35]
MKIAVLGTGMVGETIGSKLVALGHEVKMGSRSANNEKAAAWVKKAGAKASQGTFADAAAFGELLFNCTSGSGSLEALNAAGKENLEGKILLDLSNPLEFSKGMPPTLFVSNTDSLGEQIQRAFPELKVVKTLNTISANVMVDPARIPGEHAVFVSGNDAEAKGQVKRLLTEWFGWKQVIDLGDITTARGTESYLPLWLRLWGAMGTPDFNIQIVKRG